MTDTAIVVHEGQGELLAPLSMPAAVARYNAVVEFTKQIMKPGKDYGVIPGTAKPTLLKPGAEKLCSFFGLSVDYQQVEAVTDWAGGFFFFSYKATLSRHGEIVATGIGSCNSKEKKYRYRNAEQKCPSCGKPTIIKGKAEYGGGFICFAKKGGCGAKFADNDPAIANQASGQVENTEPYDLVNTIQKMAQKRALIAATLVAANASEYFTQDIEDLEIIEGEVIDDHHAPAQAAIPTPDEAFEIQVSELLASRGFAPAQIASAKAAAARKRKVLTIRDMDPKTRAELIAAIDAGKFDSLLGNAATAAR